MLEKVDPRKVDARQIMCPKCQGHSFFNGEDCGHCDERGRIYVKNDNPRPILGPYHLEKDTDKVGAWMLTGSWNVVIARSDAKTAATSPADSLATGRLLHQAYMMNEALQEIVQRGLVTHEHGVLYDNIISSLSYIKGNQDTEDGAMVEAA